MIFSKTLQTLIAQFDGHLYVCGEKIALDYFGVKLKTAKTFCSFKTLLELDKKTVSLTKLAELIDNRRRLISLKIEENTKQPFVELTLTQECGTSLITLETVAEKYLNMQYESALARFNQGELSAVGFNFFRLHDSQKAKVLILASDLAKFFLIKRDLQLD